MSVEVTRQGAVGWVTLHRPEKAHAYDRAHLDALLGGAQTLARECAVVVFGSTGERAFCGGADLDAMSGAAPLDALELYSQRVFTTIARLPVVTLAVVQGPAVAGGFELALACDLRVAGPRATFSLPETRLGILPSAGGTTRLARLCGVSRAKAVILGGEVLDADRALAWGVVHRVDADPRAEAGRWAAQVATRDRAAQALAKQALDAEESTAGLARERTIEALLYARKR